MGTGAGDYPWDSRIATELEFISSNNSREAENQILRVTAKFWNGIEGRISAGPPWLLGRN